MLCCFVLCCVVLCCVVLCYVITLPRTHVLPPARGPAGAPAAGRPDALAGAHYIFFPSYIIVYCIKLHHIILYCSLLYYALLLDCSLS